MKVRELIEKLRDEDPEAEAIVLTRFRNSRHDPQSYRLEAEKIEGKNGDFGGVAVRAEMDNEGGC